MKLAVTIWSERVAPVFDVARKLLVIEKDHEGSFTQTEIEMTSKDAMNRISFLIALGVDELICGAISKPVYLSALNNSIEVYPFVSGAINDVVKDWENGHFTNLSYSMPGCRRGNCQKKGRQRRNCRVTNDDSIQEINYERGLSCLEETEQAH